MKVATYIDGLQAIMDRGGPEVYEYEFVKEIPAEIFDIDVEAQNKLYEVFSPILTVESMLGFTFQKPHGYAGDFELIDRIYSQWHSKNLDLSKWDDFYHKLEAATAVRNRIKYFKEIVQLTEEKHKSPRVLNLGSGPCSDLYEYLQETPKTSVNFECLDMDETAIEFGSSVCDNYMDKIEFIHKNAFRFKPDYQYELIWSAGLFDYFNDKLFVRLVNRIYGLVKEGGELVIGNFSDDNPGRAIMEVFGQWYLHHREKDKLIELAIKAGVPENLIMVSQEEEGVNLFLHLRK